MKNIVVLVSGGGTNLQALIDAEKRGEIKGGKITCVISSKADAYALERAEKNDIPSVIIARKDYPDSVSYSQALLSELQKQNADLIVLAGFMTILDECVTRQYPYKIINIHPALIPSFCGEGYYGLKVHKAVLDSGVKISGATVHFVNEKADAGAIILQKSEPVEFNDTPESLQRRIMQKVEWKLLPKAVSLFCEDRIKIKDGKAFVEPSNEERNDTQTLSLITFGSDTPSHNDQRLTYRGELTWKLFQRKMHVMTGSGVTPRYAESCARELNKLSEHTINSLCRSLKEYCLMYIKMLKDEKINDAMRVPVYEDTPARDVLENITPERFVIFEQLNVTSYYIGCSCDWENVLGKNAKSGLGIGICGDKVFYVGPDFGITINDLTNKGINFAEGF